MKYIEQRTSFTHTSKNDKYLVLTMVKNPSTLQKGVFILLHKLSKGRKETGGGGYRGRKCIFQNARTAQNELREAGGELRTEAGMNAMWLV